MRPTIARSDLPALKRSYRDARDAGQGSFRFKGQILLTEYAKYVIEYLEERRK